MITPSATPQPTPLTDAFIVRLFYADWPFERRVCVGDFARELERQLAAMKAERDAIQRASSIWEGQYMNTSVDLDECKADLARVTAERDALQLAASRGKIMEAAAAPQPPTEHERNPA